ncbi:MAG: TniQ family protein [Sulfurimonas sp.]|uniref:TniQ family protein n=1 Tax=Sulfurimonas sp. TaxID=2022749 RepID=UPI00263020B7|nr:TniQ family protein [Sulfurimonas sp.]MDD5401112.1 TniQ family protein [Sulfurimonas sp.]
MNFAIEVHPHEDETLTSWVIRNAIANGSDPRSFAIAAFKKDSTWYRDIDRYIPYEKVVQLSLLCSLSQEGIRALTLESLIQNLSHKTHKDNPYSKWQLITPIGLKGAIRTNGFYFCPKCLVMDDAYLKKQWKLAWVVACPIHKNLLLLSCENCGQVFSPHKITYENPYLCYCTNCGFNLSASTTEYVNQEVLVFQEQLSQVAFKDDFMEIDFPLIENNRKDLFLTLTLFLSLFVHMNQKEKFAGIFKYLNMNDKHAFRTSNNTTFARMHIKDKEHLLFIISNLFKLSLNEIVTLLRDSEMAQNGFKRTFRNLSPTAEYIFNRLDTKKIFKPSRSLSREIVPKSKEEVERLFDEIREYIKI